MHIGIAGPLGTNDIEHLLDGDTLTFPREMKGATLLATLIEALISLGYQVSAFTTTSSLLPRRGNRTIAQGKNLKIYYVPLRRHALRSDRGARGRMLDLFSMERDCLTSVMKEANPDIIHAHWSYEYGAAALASGLPCLLTCHDSPWSVLKKQTDLYRLGRLIMALIVLRRTRNATVVSPYLIDELAHLTPAKLTVVPNPMPDNIFKIGFERTTRNFSATPPQLAMLLSGWNKLKNPEPGMLAMRRIREFYPGSRMHLFGPGFGAGEQAEHWSNEQGISDCFVFHGLTAHGDAMQALSEMDLLIHPSLEESFGMTLAEAMALGLPVVAGKSSGAVPWILDSGNAGMLVEVRSVNDIADAALSILSDTNLYYLYSTQGRKRAIENFSSNGVAQSYINQYKNIVKIKQSEVFSSGRSS